MIVRIDKSFQKDIDKIIDVKLKHSISEIVEEVQKAENILSIKNLKKMTGYKEYCRIKMGDYRIGLKYTKNNELIFLRFLNRKDIYKQWP